MKFEQRPERKRMESSGHREKRGTTKALETCGCWLVICAVILKAFELPLSSGREIADRRTVTGEQEGRV